MEKVDRGVLVLQHPNEFFFDDKDVETCGGSKGMTGLDQADAVDSPPKSTKAPAAAVRAWFGKMKGGSAKPPPAPPLLDVSPHVFRTIVTLASCICIQRSALLSLPFVFKSCCHASAMP